MRLAPGPPTARRAPASALYQEALARGFLLRDCKGDTLVQTSASPIFTFGTVDLASPAARAWYAGVIGRMMSDAGLSGWMADFGEYLPYNARRSPSAPAADGGAASPPPCTDSLLTADVGANELHNQ